MSAVHRTFALIFTDLNEGPDQGAQREREVSLLLMEPIEALTVPSAQEGNS